jgi:hypothetical protein
MVSNFDRGPAAEKARRLEEMGLARNFDGGNAVLADLERSLNGLDTELMALVVSGVE